MTRFATAIAILTSPAPFAWFHFGQGWSIGWSLVATFFTVIAFRGLIDLLTRRLLPWPSLYGTDDADLKEEDVVNRRRASFWRFWLKFFVIVTTLLTLVFLLRLLIPGGTTNWIDSSTGIWTGSKGYIAQNAGNPLCPPDLLPLQLPDPPRPDDDDRDLADARLRARRRGLGGSAR